MIPSCNNQIAAYQYVEYQCIPTKTESCFTPNTSCPTDGSKTIPIQINRRGRFQSYKYPQFTTNMNCTYRVKTTPGDIMNFYALRY